MTVEDAIQATLDANPADHLARMVLADYLDEINDPRGPGYREIGRLGIYPRYSSEVFPGSCQTVGAKLGAWEWWSSEIKYAMWEIHCIPHLAWFDAIKTAKPHHIYYGTSDDPNRSVKSRDFLSRRAADDAAAIAYSTVVKTVGAT